MARKELDILPADEAGERESGKAGKLPNSPTPQLPDSEALLDRELKTIFGNEGEARDMTKLDIARSSWAKKLLVGLVVFFGVLASISWAGFFFFAPPGPKFTGDGVSLAIEGPAEPKGGEVVTYVLRYKNGEKIPLGTASLALRVPPELQVVDTDPKAGDDNQWNIGSIAPDKEGSIAVKALAMAPLQKNFDLQAILTYRPADFNSEFQKVTTRGLAVTDSVLQLAATGPAKVLPGDKVTFTFEYKNPSDRDFKNVRFAPAFPPAFILDSATPAAADDTNAFWNIPSLKAGASGKIVLNGTFSSDAKGEIDLKGQLGLVQDNVFLLQRESGAHVTVLEGQLVTNLILNGKTDNQAVDFGETLRYSLTWRNTGAAALGDVSLTAVFETEPVSPKVLLWNNLKDAQDGVRDGNKLTWTKKQVTSLGKISGNGEGAIDFDIPILAAPIAGNSAVEYAVTCWVEATIGTIDGDKVDRLVKTAPLIAKINSDTKFSAEARYFNADNIPIGSGPLPPQVGKQTVYRVFWKLENSLHELTDLRVSAPLDTNAIWTGASTVDAGELKFDAGSGKMVWTLNRMPTSVKSLGVSFDVGLTPGEDARGKIASIISATTLEAIDKVTGALVITSLPPLTTQLDNDPGAAGKAKVQ